MTWPVGDAGHHPCVGVVDADVALGPGMGAQHLGGTTASAVPLHLGHHDGALFLEFGEHLGDRRSGDAELGGIWPRVRCTPECRRPSTATRCCSLAFLCESMGDS